MGKKMTPLKKKLMLTCWRPWYYRFRSRPAAIGTTTICVMLNTIPFTSIGNFFPMSKSNKSGVTKTAEAVDSDVITMLKGAIFGSVRKVA